MDEKKRDVNDSNLRRLKHGLDSLWRPDEGLQAQMNSVIGALQELKLLQVKTALDELEFSTKKGQQSPLTSSRLHHQSSGRAQQNQNQHTKLMSSINSELVMDPSLILTSSPVEIHQMSRAPHRGSLSTSSSFSSQGDSTNSSFSSYDIEDPSDWTTSLNQSRNRQPLILGDNVFADLVGNWLDLPDVGGLTSRNEQNDLTLKHTFFKPQPLGNSQDLSKNLSLTKSVFKRVLLRIGGWQNQDSEVMDISKQPQLPRRKPKSDGCKPFWRRTRGMKRKNTPIQREDVVNQESEGFINTSVEIVEKHPPVFDYKSAVWV
ncbi:hypothetical protein DNTS_013067 [Danionella cerebrum]|uniref:FAM212 domain-containing protein n=1 Tax=Danionella cerebrum TaxID=2873325 RepID=A0A553RFD8_9TELE|nr:hypothetical protein DNTS_013067 [Danionella translucida]